MMPDFLTQLASRNERLRSAIVAAAAIGLFVAAPARGDDFYQHTQRLTNLVNDASKAIDKLNGAADASFVSKARSYRDSLLAKKLELERIASDLANQQSPIDQKAGTVSFRKLEHESALRVYENFARQYEAKQKALEDEIAVHNRKPKQLEEEIAAFEEVKERFERELAAYNRECAECQQAIDAHNATSDVPRSGPDLERYNQEAARLNTWKNRLEARQPYFERRIRELNEQRAELQARSNRIDQAAAKLNQRKEDLITTDGKRLVELRLAASKKEREYVDVRSELERMKQQYDQRAGDFNVALDAASSIHVELATAIQHAANSATVSQTPASTPVTQQNVVASGPQQPTTQPQRPPTGSTADAAREATHAEVLGQIARRERELAELRELEDKLSGLIERMMKDDNWRDELDDWVKESQQAQKTAILASVALLLGDEGPLDELISKYRGMANTHRGFADDIYTAWRKHQHQLNEARKRVKQISRIKVKSRRKEVQAAYDAMRKIDDIMAGSLQLQVGTADRFRQFAGDLDSLRQLAKAVSDAAKALDAAEKLIEPAAKQDLQAAVKAVQDTVVSFLTDQALEKLDDALVKRGAKALARQTRLLKFGVDYTLASFQFYLSYRNVNDILEQIDNREAVAAKIRQQHKDVVDDMVQVQKEKERLEQVKSQNSTAMRKALNDVAAWQEFRNCPPRI